MEPLRPVRRRTAADTDGKRFCDVFRDGQQLGHGIERPGAIVLIEPGNDHPLSLISHLIANLDQVEIKKLGFIDSDNLRLTFEPSQNLRGCRNEFRFYFHIAVADDVILAEAVIQPGLEDLHALLCNLGSPKSADQFLALSTEHAAADHFDRTEVMVRVLK
jgi:hypothetical protein